MIGSSKWDDWDSLPKKVVDSTISMCVRVDLKITRFFKRKENGSTFCRNRKSPRFFRGRKTKQF